MYQTNEIKVEGMTCGHCVATVKRVIESINGIKDVEVDLESGKARVKIEVYKTSKKEVIDAINNDTIYKAS